VSEVLERSAATFAGVLRGDVLLQVDDRVVSGKEDIVRYFTFFPPIVSIQRGAYAWTSLISDA
jgi:S1-C subfamily serine protease